MNRKIKVVLVENDLDFVFLIQKMIKQDEKLQFCGFAANRCDGLALAQTTHPDIVLMDLNLSNCKLDGIDAAKEIRLSTSAKVLLLTSFEQPEMVINASKQAFASGYIFKSAFQTLNDTIYQTAVSHTPLEHMIKHLVLQDLSAAEQSVVDNILENTVNSQSSTGTIANQKTNIFKKLGLKNTYDLLHIFKNW